LDHRRFDVLFSRLCAIAARVEPLTLENATTKGMWYGPRGFFILPSEPNREYHQFITDILRHSDWEQKFSRQYLNARLRPVLEEYNLAGEAAARVALQSLVDHLAAFSEAHTVYLPLLGVTMDDAPRRELGGIILHRATDDFLKSITTPETKAYIKRQTETFVWTEITIIAEPHRAATRAEEACQPLIDVMRFWMACMAPPGTPCAIGLQGDIITAERPRIITNDQAQHCYDPHPSRVIPGLPLTDHTMNLLQTAHIDDLAVLTTTPIAQQSQFTKLLLHALHLFGNATTAALQTDRFMHLIMTLEAFLTVGDAPISQSVAEGVVIFLAVPVAERVRLKKELQRFYKLRSKLAHGEQTSVPPTDLYTLEDLTRTFLLAMIQHRNAYASKEGYLAALEARRLS
jgi:hypothetical protein